MLRLSLVSLRGRHEPDRLSRTHCHGSWKGKEKRFSPSHTRLWRQLWIPHVREPCKACDVSNLSVPCFTRARLWSPSHDPSGQKCRKWSPKDSRWALCIVRFNGQPPGALAACYPPVVCLRGNGLYKVGCRMLALYKEVLRVQVRTIR